MTYSIPRSQALHTIPQRKLSDALENTIRNCATCKEKRIEDACQNCKILNVAIRRYDESNIPVLYWNIEMNKDFTGDDVLLQYYKEITADLQASYRSGVALCFAGSFGVGKSLTICNILKKASLKNYTCLYCNLSDVVNMITSPISEDRDTARRELLMVDFLAIDEFDPRYMGTDKAADLYGKVLEEIIRTRHQNKLPIFMSTNSPNVVNSFIGPLQMSISSLMNCVKTVPITGKDHRKIK